MNKTAKKISVAVTPPLIASSPGIVTSHTLVIPSAAYAITELGPANR